MRIKPVQYAGAGVAAKTLCMLRNDDKDYRDGAEQHGSYPKPNTLAHFVQLKLGLPTAVMPSNSMNPSQRYLCL